MGRLTLRILDTKAHILRANTAMDAAGAAGEIEDSGEIILSSSSRR